MQEAGEQVTLFDLGLPYTKTSKECSAQTKEGTSKQYSRKSQGSRSQIVPTCLCLKVTGSGANADAYTMSWEDGALLGDYMMPSSGGQPTLLLDECSSSEPHNGVVVSRLSQILEECAPQKYYLSEKACIGILRRASRRGKPLPEALETALKIRAGIIPLMADPSRKSMTQEVTETEA